MIVRLMADKAKNAKDAAVKKPPIETASWCFRDKEEDVHHDFAWTITNFSRKINLVPNGERCSSSPPVTTLLDIRGIHRVRQILCFCPRDGPGVAALPLPEWEGLR